MSIYCYVNRVSVSDQELLVWGIVEIVVFQQLDSRVNLS